MLSLAGMVVAAVGCGSDVDKEDFADVWRAAVELQAATTAGVTYNDLGPMVQDLVAEIGLLPQDLSETEQDIARKLADIAQAYDDSMALWEQTLKYGDSLPYVFVFDEWSAILDRYGVSSREQDAFLEVWVWASDSIDELRPAIAP